SSWRGTRSGAFKIDSMRFVIEQITLRQDSRPVHGWIRMHVVVPDACAHRWTDGQVDKSADHFPVIMGQAAFVAVADEACDAGVSVGDYRQARAACLECGDAERLKLRGSNVNVDVFIQGPNPLVVCGTKETYPVGHVVSTNGSL